jgi:hypothetical protein
MGQHSYGDVVDPRRVPLNDLFQRLPFAANGTADKTAVVNVGVRHGIPPALLDTAGRTM